MPPILRHSYLVHSYHLLFVAMYNYIWINLFSKKKKKNRRVFSVVWTYNQWWSSENLIWPAFSVSRLSPMRAVNRFAFLSLAALLPPLLISVMERDTLLFWYQTWLSWWLDGLGGMDKHRDSSSWTAMIVMGAWLKYVGLPDKIQDSHLNDDERPRLWYLFTPAEILSDVEWDVFILR